MRIKINPGVETTAYIIACVIVGSFVLGGCSARVVKEAPPLFFGADNNDPFTKCLRLNGLKRDPIEHCLKTVKDFEPLPYRGKTKT